MAEEPKNDFVTSTMGEAGTKRGNMYYVETPGSTWELCHGIPVSYPRLPFLLSGGLNENLGRSAQEDHRRLHGLT
jgi:hypothetical protein